MLKNANEGADYLVNQEHGPRYVNLRALVILRKYYMVVKFKSTTKPRHCFSLKTI